MTLAWFMFLLWAFASGALVSFIKPPVLRMVMLVAVIIFNWLFARWLL